MNLGTVVQPRVLGANDLGTPIQFVKGVGPTKALVFEKVGVRTLEDLLQYMPRDHQDRRTVPLKEAVVGKKQAFLVTVQSIEFLRSGKMLGTARARVKEGSQSIEAVWFKHLSFRYDVFAGVKRDVVEGRRLLLYGLVDKGPHGVELRVDDHEVVETDFYSGRIVPVYPLTEGLTDRWLRQLMERTVPTGAMQIADPLPATLRSQQKLPDYSSALRRYHFPASWSDRDEARNRLAFDEFFFLELALGINRAERNQHRKSFSYELRKNLLTPFRQQLGFELTKAQAHVINEIFRDMQSPVPMNRLLQGDVGSGKTVVALSAALLAIENGLQVAFLAPTEILAGQHALSIQRFFDGLPITVALLTGSTTKLEKTKIISKLKTGKIQLLIGTHAILGNDVEFQKLGLVIVDEQHRFGVRQRAKLLNKSEEPDVLIMTATPIPRTLALSIYGDLDISVIDASPEGRTPIRSRLSSETAAMNRIEEELKAGRQAYVVFPLVEESELLAKRSGKAVLAATKEYDRLRQRFSGYTTALLHGQMDSHEKKEVMDKFRSGKISVLVSTPVIEVGIDVPNATVMAIVNPERFGLAQLHQLRGRVGRGVHPSECLLVHEPTMDGEMDRLTLFTLIDNGFRLAEEDLKLRGPGEFMGEAQHGLPFFRVGDLVKDGLLIAQAREAARTVVEGEVALTMKEFSALNRVLQKRFGTKLHLSKVG